MPTPRKFEHVDFDVEKSLYLDEANDSIGQLSANNHSDGGLMVHRVHTNLTDTLESHSDVKHQPEQIATEKGMTTSIDMTPTNNEKAEAISTDSEELVKKESKFGLFYKRHRVWFQ
jgi:hypothetical protein